jgi:hypothetical protein
VAKGVKGVNRVHQLVARIVEAPAKVMIAMETGRNLFVDAR